MTYTEVDAINLMPSANYSLMWAVFGSKFIKQLVGLMLCNANLARRDEFICPSGGCVVIPFDFDKF